MPFFDHDGIQFCYEVIGKGEPIAFCHGLSGDRHLVKPLLENFSSNQLVFWDCRGHGDTAPMGDIGRINFCTLAEDLAALLNHLGIEKCTIGGVSMGAGISTNFATRWPERVRGLILGRPAWLDQPAPPNLNILLFAAQLLEEEDKNLAFQKFRQSKDFQMRQQITGESAEEVWAQFIKPGSVERRQRITQMVRSCPIRSWEDVAVVNMPTLVIGCDRDPVHPLEYAVTWSQKLPHATFVQIPPRSDNIAVYNAAFRTNLKHFLDQLESTPTD